MHRWRVWILAKRQVDEQRLTVPQSILGQAPAEIPLERSAPWPESISLGTRVWTCCEPAVANRAKKEKKQATLSPQWPRTSQGCSYPWGNIGQGGREISNVREGTMTCFIEKIRSVQNLCCISPSKAKYQIAWNSIANMCTYVPFYRARSAHLC